MNEFYIDVKLSQGITRIQVDEVPPEQWDMPYTPQFIIEFYDSEGFITLTLQLEQGKWHDRNARIPGDEFHVYHFDENAGSCRASYQSPLSELAIQQIGQSIGRHMIVHLTTYMALFVPVFRTPALN